MQGEVARQKMRHQERTVFDVEEGNLAAVARLPKEYIFKYVVGAREAKTLAMTRGWGPDVCSIARSTFRCLACPCVVLGRDLACRPVPTVSMRAKCPQSAMPAPSVASRQFHNIRFTFCESRSVNYTNRTLFSRKSHTGRPLAAQPLRVRRRTEGISPDRSRTGTRLGDSYYRERRQVIPHRAAPLRQDFNSGRRQGKTE